MLPTTRSDSELTAAVRDGDPEAYGELWQRHADAGRAAARRITRSFDADDLVAEAFARILEALQAGRGPDGPFRPYLYTTIQRLAATWGTRTAPTVPIDDADHPVEQSDHTARLTEGSLVGRAYASLPAAWAEVLWYTELEELSPAEAAPLLGLAPNSTAALAYRAREGLRRAWLQAHVAHLPEKPACRWVAERVGDFHRGALPTRARHRFEAHVAECEDCPVLVAEVGDEADILLRARLAGVLWPAVLGATALLPGVMPGIAGASAAGAAGPGGPVPGPGRVLGRGRSRTSRRLGRTGATAVVAAVVVAVVALAAVAGVTAWIRTTDAAPPTAQSTAAPVEPADDADRTADEDGRDGAGTRDESVPAHEEPAVDPAPPVAPAPEADRVRPHTDRPAAVVAPVEDVLAVEPVAPVVPAIPDPGPVDPVDPVDPVAAPTVVSVIDDPHYLPLVVGRAEPGADVTLRTSDGTVAGTVRAGADGNWQIAADLPVTAGQAFTLVVQQQVDGVASPPSDPLGPFTLVTPEVLSPAEGDTVTLTDRDGDGQADDLEVRFTGTDGLLVQAAVDGVTTGNTHVLTAQPLVRVVYDLAPGTHTFGVRYADPARGLLGVWTTVTFEVP